MLIYAPLNSWKCRGLSVERQIIMCITNMQGNKSVWEEVAQKESFGGLS